MSRYEVGVITLLLKEHSRAAALARRAGIKRLKIRVECVAGAAVGKLMKSIAQTRFNGPSGVAGPTPWCLP